MKQFSVAAGHSVTLDAAAVVLDEGGTAVDAAVAAAMAAMVAEPVLAGLLGGGFLYYAIRLMKGEDEKIAMQTFGYSIWYLMALFTFLLVDHYLPFFT